MDTKNVAPTQQSILPLPHISPEVGDQLHRVFAEIDYLAVPAEYLLTTIDATQGLSEDNLVSDLTLRCLRNEVKMVRARYDYSTSWRPWFYVGYHALFITPLVEAKWRQYYSSSQFPGVIGASLLAISGLYTHRIRVDLDDRLGMVPRKTTGVAVMGGFVGLLASVVVHGVGGSLSPLTIVATRLGGLHEAWAMNMLQNYTNKALAE